MSLEKLKKSYKPNISKFRRKWINLFRSYRKKNKLQPSVVIVFTSFILSITITLMGFEKYGFLPFAIGCSFILISLVYFRLYPLSWSEMTEEEKEAYRFFNKLSNDWDLNK